MRAGNARDTAECNAQCIDNCNCMVFKEEDKLKYRNQSLINDVNKKEGTKHLRFLYSAGAAFTEKAW